MGNYWSASSDNADKKEYTKVIDDSGARVSTLCENGELKTWIYDDGRTTYEAFLRGQKLSNNGPYLGRRLTPDGPYEWLSYQEVADMSDAFGSGLINDCHLSPDNETRVGIFSQNRVEWVVCDQATARFSMVLVPLYSTLGREACRHIVDEAELSVVVCDTADKVDTLLDIVENLTCLKHVVVMDAVSEEIKERVKENNLTLHSFEDLTASGQAAPQSLKPAQTEDICTICYTSGTTGIPKGVVITHQALLISSHCGQSIFEDILVNINHNDVFISYLPLTHIFEKYNLIACTLNGAKMGFFSGNISKLMNDIQTLQPTILPAVPRLLYKVYDTIYNGAAESWLKQKLIDWAVSSKLAAYQKADFRSDTIWDKLVFSKVRQYFGGKVRHIGTGGAPTDPTVLAFFRIALSCTLCVGYGQTELCGAATLTMPHDVHNDHVGFPIPCNMIKLIDAPDLGYFARDGYGEICVKGANVFREYFKQPEKTAETIDADGWCHTGDIGTWTPEGNLKIIDRCKQIFKLSQGEYIAPERVEGVYTRCRHVAQIFVDGLSDKDFLVAVVVPDFEALSSSLSMTVDPVEICKDLEVQNMILQEMTAMGRENHLKGFEIVKQIYLHPEPFTPESGLLTVTHKSRRNELRKRFADEVKEMYER